MNSTMFANALMDRWEAEARQKAEVDLSNRSVASLVHQNRLLERWNRECPKVIELAGESTAGAVIDLSVPVPVSGTDRLLARWDAQFPDERGRK